VPSVGFGPVPQTVTSGDFNNDRLPDRLVTDLADAHDQQRVHRGRRLLQRGRHRRGQQSTDHDTQPFRAPHDRLDAYSRG
jgi:hypothetical protein